VSRTNAWAIIATGLVRQGVQNLKQKNGVNMGLAGWHDLAIFGGIFCGSVLFAGALLSILKGGKQ